MSDLVNWYQQFDLTVMAINESDIENQVERGTIMKITKADRSQ